MNAGSGILQPRAWHYHTRWGPSLPWCYCCLGVFCYPTSLLLEPGRQWDELGEQVSPALGS